MYSSKSIFYQLDNLSECASINLKKKTSVRLCHIQRVRHRNSGFSFGSTLPSHRATQSWDSFDQPYRNYKKKK